MKDKAIKNMVTTEFAYNYVRDKRTVGVIREYPDRRGGGSGRAHRRDLRTHPNHRSHVDDAGAPEASLRVLSRTASMTTGT